MLYVLLLKHRQFFLLILMWNMYYKPKIWLILADIAIIFINIFLGLSFLPLTSRSPFQKYFVPALFFVFFWIIISFIFRRYIKLREQEFYKATFSLFYTSIINFFFFAFYIIIQEASQFSQYVLYAIMSGIFISEYLFLFIYFAYRYAVQYDVPVSSIELRENAKLLPSEPLSIEEIEQRQHITLTNTNNKILAFLTENGALLESSTFLMEKLRIDKLSDVPYYKYNTFIQLRKLNKLRGINKMLYLINEKLPDNGRIIISYTSKSTQKRNIYKMYPIIIRDVAYFLFYILHRAIPKFFLTSRLYYDITGGNYRILSKTEVLGRLVFCGFEIEKQTKIDSRNIVIARRIKQSESIKPRRNYGPLIKLKRKGKNGTEFYVYKMRTMHPYSEYLQGYIYQQNKLQEGGKFYKDIRVTTLGKLMRKYWIDELPMFINLIKGDIKLIGVRPLSNHYFSLYSTQLQQKRTKYRPGLLPPFYADLPKTLDEIQASEMKYLNECESKGVIITDTKYFFLILKNIFFRKAHSA